MLWQEDVRVIAMITNEVEKGKVSAKRYIIIDTSDQEKKGIKNDNNFSAHRFNTSYRNIFCFKISHIF